MQLLQFEDFRAFYKVAKRRAETNSLLSSSDSPLVDLAGPNTNLYYFAGGFGVTIFL